MATSIPHDSPCATCGKLASTFTCRGCTKDFCLRHTIEHRQELTKQMDEDIIPLHDQLRQYFDGQAGKIDSHPLMKEINRWEQISIAKIHQAANDARQQLSNVLSRYTNKMRETLKDLTQQLKKARDDDYFFETDLKEWMKQLDKFKKDFVTPKTVHIQYDNNATAFISKILIGETADVLNERLEQFIGNIPITNNGTVITHNQTATHASVRGSREYSKGEHHLRFVIENLSAHKWILVGIVSKAAAAPTNPSVSTTFYGFLGQSYVVCNGSLMGGLNGYRSDFETNDTIELLMNCDRRKICLINERTGKTDTLDVDVSKCPFPWKLNVGFYHSPGERIRILSSS